jgi:hypothetical protein
MRTFDLSQRIDTSLETIEKFFGPEYAYYTQHNVYPFEFAEQAYTSIYRRLNVQLLVTKKCPFSCPFCVERLNPVGDENRDEIKQCQTLDSLFCALLYAGLFPTLSITGGEPLLYPDHLSFLFYRLNAINTTYNLNTSGAPYHDCLQNARRINLSVHNYFGVERGQYWNLPHFRNATIQTVLQDNNFDNFIAFINSFDHTRFSLRFPTDAEGSRNLCWKPLLDRVVADPRFRFIQQKIGDYYWYEEYKYGEKTLRFSFSSLRQLAKYKQAGDGNNVRAVVIMPDGTIQFDWLTN